ncbi:MAG: zf-TFIIB domain-containing protein [Planctomycetes bacterium]|nr:zf-TFIIB domain-containing protein [Planctomycetota bacterium]
MDCPVCDEPLQEVEYEGVKLDHCEKCDGFWLDAGEIQKVNAIHEKTFSEEQIAKAVDLLEKKAIVGKSGETRRIKCPKCGKECKVTSTSGVSVDKCPDGEGMWLDKGEIEKLQIMAEERSRIYTDEEKQEFREGADSLSIFRHFSVFMHKVLKRD